MSYVGPPFAHDVFVSYSHGDVNHDGSSKLKAWSQAFVRELESELQAHPRFGADLRIFLDHHERPSQGIDPMAPLTDQLKGAIAQSALLTVLMSPHYLGSKWCADERDWWMKSQSEHALRHDERIAVVRMWHSTETWPQALLDERGEQRTGFLFYDRKQAAHRPQPFEWPAPEPTSKGPFREALLDLVGWLAAKLDDFKVQLDERRRAQQDAQKLAGGGQLVYLHARADQTAAWERAGEALSRHGFAVLPGEPDSVERDPKKAQGLRDRRVEILSGCDALLLVGGSDGRAVDADMVLVGRQDRHSARAIVNRALPCGLLDTVGTPVATTQRMSAARALQVDWIDATREPWTEQVQSWLVTKGAALGRAQ